MKKGLIAIGISLGVAVLLLVIWIVGFVAHIGGALIHLLLMMAMIIGCIGTVAGLGLLIVNRGK